MASAKNQQPSKPQSQTVTGICVFLVIAVFAVFGQGGRFLFVNYDDNLYVYENAIVQKGLTWEGIKFAFTYTGIGHWHPLTWITHLMDCQIYGTTAGGPHLENAAIHAASAVLLFLVLRTMTGFLWRSAMVAAIFAVHPLRAESVAWIAERKDVLGTFFFMLTLCTYVRYLRKPSKLRYALTLGMFAVGLLCKNMLVTLPCVMLLLDYWPLRRMESFGARLVEKIPFFLLTLVSCVITNRSAEKVEGANIYPLMWRLESAILSTAIYIRQTLLPVHLFIPHPYPRNGPNLMEVSVAAMFLLGITAVTIGLRKRHPAYLTGWLWYLGMLVPVSGIVQASYFAYGDHFTYLPGIGLTLALVWAAADFLAKRRVSKIVIGSIAGTAVLVLTVCANIQTSHWRDGRALWEHTVACMPLNYYGHQNLADLFRQQGNLDAAKVEYEHALEAEPDSFRTVDDIGNIYGMKGDTVNALAEFQKALKIEPTFAETHLDLGNVLFTRGELDKAIAEYREAARLAPKSSDAHNDLGKALGAKGDDNAAIAEYRIAVELQPDDTTSQFNLGNRLLKVGQWDEAIPHFQKVLAINPNDAGARNNLGRAYLLKGDGAAALACFEATTQLPPDPVTKWTAIGAGFQMQKRWPEFIACLREADNASNHRNPEILRQLALAYASDGKFSDAVNIAEQASALAKEQRNDVLAAALEKDLQSYRSKNQTNLP